MSWLIEVSYNIRIDVGEFDFRKEVKLIKDATTFAGAVALFTKWTQDQIPEVVHINDIKDMTI